ncbi:MAG: MG2 domain-containing protein [bacterium]
MRAAVAVERATKVLVTTDKPLYQPGQTMHLRALALRRPDLGPDAGREVVWEIFDGKDNKVERLQSETDAFGVTSAKFELAREVNQGRYRIVTTVGDTVTEKTVNVERYALPKFDLDLDLDREVYFAGDTMTGTIRARYFFGQAVAGGTVSLSASTLDAGETVFAELHGATNEEGLYRFELQVPAYLVGQPLEQGGALLQLALEVTDTAGQARSVSRTVRVAKGPLEVAVVPESGSYVAGIQQKLLLRSLDAAGHPVAATFHLTVNGVEQDPVDTDANGLGSAVVFSRETQLAVQVRATRGDDAIEGSYTFVAGDPSPDGAVLLRTDKALYRVGDTLKIDAEVVGAPDRVYMDVVRGGQTVLTETLKPDGNGHATYDLTLTPDHAGPLKVSVYYLAQGSTLRRDTATVYVDLANQLAVEMTTDRPVYAPGEEATLTVKVTDAEGNGRAAAVGLQGVDEAVFSLMEFRPGLENTYFRIEGELGQPRYQVGVPGLATLVSGGGADQDPVRQAQAELLFAASGDEALQPIAINTFQNAVAALPALIRPALQQQVEAFGARLEEAARASGQPETFDVASWVVRNSRALFDPWGQAMVVEHPGGWQIQATSRGPDEVAGTADDQVLSLDISQRLFPPPPAPEGEWEGAPNAGAGGDFADGDGVQAPADERDDAGGGGGVRVRRNFPETLFVEPALITDGTGGRRCRCPWPTASPPGA